jgi:hypothetical protein
MDIDMDPVSVRAVEQKRALCATLDGARRPLKAIADIVGVAPQTLCAWRDETVDAHMPSARIPAILAAAPEDDSLVRYWASLQNRTVVALPSAGIAPADVLQLAELAGAFAALLQCQVDCAKDGRWTAREVEQLRPIAHELAARALAHLAYAERAVGRPV